MEVKPLDAAAPFFHLGEEPRLLDRDLGMDEEGDRKAELGGPVHVTANEPVAVGPGLRPGGGRMGAGRRGLDVHGDDDMQLVHGVILVC